MRELGQASFLCHFANKLCPFGKWDCDGQQQEHPAYTSGFSAAGRL